MKVDIRLISATHRDLLQQVKDGKFREDLFYRLNVYPIVVPPLRERRADIPHLVRHFMARPTSGRGAPPRVEAISDSALAMLGSYDWPGNIRQLENAVFRALVLCEGDVLTEEEFPQIRAQVEGSIDLDRDEPALAAISTAAPSEAAPPAAAKTFGILRAMDERGNVRPLADIEIEMIRLAIEHYRGQMSEVARRLGIGRSTLYRKFKEYGIDPENGRVERENGPVDKLAS
jgi:DNA-binding NtrC family response regulator